MLLGDYENHALAAVAAKSQPIGPCKDKGLQLYGTRAARTVRAGCDSVILPGRAELTAQLPKQPKNMPAMAPVSANTPAQHSSRLGGTACPSPPPQTNAEGPVERPLSCQLFRSNSAFAGDSDEASEEAAAATPAHVNDAEVVARLRRRVSRLSTGEFDGARISRRARAAPPISHLAATGSQPVDVGATSSNDAAPIGLGSGSGSGEDHTVAAAAGAERLQHVVEQYLCGAGGRSLAERGRALRSGAGAQPLHALDGLQQLAHAVLQHCVAQVRSGSGGEGAARRGSRQGSGQGQTMGSRFVARITPRKRRRSQAQLDAGTIAFTPAATLATSQIEGGGDLPLVLTEDAEQRGFDLILEVLLGECNGSVIDASCPPFTSKCH
jgi:hypothetical protein